MAVFETILATLRFVLNKPESGSYQLPTRSVQFCVEIIYRAVTLTLDAGR